MVQSSDAAQVYFTVTVILITLLCSNEVGEKFYETAMAPKFHEQMGLKIEQEMLLREANWRSEGCVLPSDAESAMSEDGGDGGGGSVDKPKRRGRPPGAGNSRKQSTSVDSVPEIEKPRRGRAQVIDNSKKWNRRCKSH